MNDTRGVSAETQALASLLFPQGPTQRNHNYLETQRLLIANTESEWYGNCLNEDVDATTAGEPSGAFFENLRRENYPAGLPSEDAAGPTSPAAVRAAHAVHFVRPK
jgi:hypothetical protein